MKRKLIIILYFLSLFFLFSFNVFAEEVDVILFTGQSNMVGRGAVNIGNGNNADFSNIDGKIYEYKYFSNSLVEYNASNNIPSLLGEAKRICNISGAFCVISENWSYAFVAEFAEQYAKLTGRNVVVVPAAVGGRGIAYFDPNYVADTMSSASDNIFNFLVKKYNGAISYLKSNGYTIGNQFYVMYNGEGDNNFTYDQYRQRYLNFHNNIINSTTLEFGAVVNPGLYYTDTTYTTLKQEYKVGEYQKKLVNSTSNLILATDKAVSLSTYPTVKNNYTDTVHFNLNNLKLIGIDAAKNIVAKKNFYKKYIVKYDCNGAGGLMSSSTHRYDTASKLSANICNKENYTFKGWSVSKDSNTIKYTDQQSVKNLVSENNGSITLYAVWEPYKYTIKYDCNSGEGDISPSVYKYEEEKALSKNSCGKEGYMFKGWSVSKETTEVTYTEEQLVKNLVSNNSGSITLYAVWEPITYTIKYDCNSGEGEMSPSAYKYEEEKALSKNSCGKEGYMFKGWAVSKDSKIVTYTEEQLVKNLVSDNNGSIILYAVWLQHGDNSTQHLENNGIMISYTSANFDQKISLSVDLIHNGKLSNNDISLLDNIFESYLVYDVSILDENKDSIQPKGIINVYFPIPEGYDKDNLIIGRIDDNELINYDIVIVDNKLMIETDHFSKYVIGQKKVISNSKIDVSIFFAIGAILLGIVIIVLSNIKSKNKV